MSSSFRKRLAFVALFGVPAAWAQQTYFVPAAEVSAERHTNRTLQSDDSQGPGDTNVYKVTIEGLLGRDTPRTTTTLRPRIVAQEFPDVSGVDRMEYFLKLNHDYRMLRGRFGLAGDFAQQDTINSEFGVPPDDDDDPATPPPPIDDGSGFVQVNRTRRSYSLIPSFDHRFTEKIGLAGNLQLRSVRYDDGAIVTDQHSFDSGQVELGLVYKIDPRTSWSAGPYYSRYKLKEDPLEPDSSFKTNTYGLRLGLDHMWSELSQISVALRGERNETFCDCLIPLVSGKTSVWGVEIVGIRRSEVGNLRYGVGRFLTPSTIGNRRQSDQFQLEYDRKLSEKLGLHTSLRASSDESVTTTSAEPGKRKRIRGELSFNRLITQTWYVEGGYRYGWQDFLNGDRTADDHTVFVSLGIKGRDPTKGNAR